MNVASFLAAVLATTALAAACSGTNFAGSGKDKAAATPKPTDSGGKGPTGGQSDGQDGGTSGTDAKDGGAKKGMLDGKDDDGDGKDDAKDDGKDEKDGKSVDKDGKDAKDGKDEQPQIDLGEAQKKPCTVNVGYDPASVQCNLPLGGSNIWTVTDGWKENVAVFSDKAAAWISPLAPQNSDDDGPFCPRVPQNEKLIYVSHFKVATAGQHTVEVLNDNTGAVRLWRAADPAQQKLAHPTSNAHSPANVLLEKGHYAIVVDGQDFGVASAIVLSIKAGGNVVKRSTSDGSWCIFRVPAATDVNTYVPQAAGCRPCFTGP